MRKIIVLAACLCTFSVSYAQKASSPAKTQGSNLQKMIATKRCAASGTIRDAKNFPLKNVKIFIYAADSSISASGYTDEKGHYETNSVAPGTYDVKIAYPSQKAMMITGVIMKPGFTALNLKANVPEADGSMPYSDIAPKPAEKKKKK